MEDSVGGGGYSSSTEGGGVEAEFGEPRREREEWTWTSADSS